jgi:glyoxylase-like metal-dependent hydrolase (beta-lactamase superfamily II)
MEKSVYEVIQIGDDVWRIEENVVRACLFAGAEKALLVDSGFGTGDLKAVVASLTDRPLMLVNTHADHDHIGGNKQFERAYLHPYELDAYRRTVGEDLVVEPVSEGDVIDLGNRRFEIILIPGHTPGGIALLDAENRILVAGDNVQAGTIFMVGPGRDMDAYIAGLKKLRDMRERFDVVYPSHGPFPVSAEIIHELIRGAEKIQDGSIQGAPPPFDPPPFAVDAKLYDVFVANILF